MSGKLKISFEGADALPLIHFSTRADETGRCVGIRFEPSLAHSGVDCTFIMDGGGEVSNIRIPDLTLPNVIAAIVEASKIMYAGVTANAKQHNFIATVERGH